jgi:outer membrane biosynthesis protein TonB
LIGAVAMIVTVGVWLALRPSEEKPITPPELADVSEEALQAPRPAPSAIDATPSVAEQPTEIATPSVNAPAAAHSPATARAPAPARVPAYAAASTASPMIASAPEAAQLDSGSGVTLRVVPEVRANILNRIRGKVRVNVRVLLDPSGNVVGQLMEDSGPSRYFARVAAESASNWKFMPADETNSRVWLLKYVFARDGVNVDATAAK